MAKLGFPGVIVAAPHALAGLDIPSNIRVIPGGLGYDECHKLAQGALVNVIPLGDDQTPCGTVTVVDAMRMGCSIVATRCIGTEDYIANDHSGLLVSPGDVDGMAAAIRRLWENGTQRMLFAQNAAEFARKNLSDEAAGVRLSDILSQVEQEWRAARVLTVCEETTA